MNRSIRSVFISLFAALAFVACAATVRNLQPGQDFPAGLAIFNYFTQNSLTGTAHELVQSYRPAKDGEPAKLDNGYADSRTLMWGVRQSAYRVVKADYDPYGDGAKAVRDGFFAAAKLAASHPLAVRWFYGANVDAVLNEMVRYAQRHTKQNEWDVGPLTVAQTTQMFELYAQLAEQSAPYFELVAQDVAPNVQADFDWLASKLSCYDFGEYDSPERKRCNMLLGHDGEESPDSLPARLRASSGLPFDSMGFDAWKFAMRRKAQGGPELVETFADLIRDAAQRARAKAAELRSVK